MAESDPARAAAQQEVYGLGPLEQQLMQVVWSAGEVSVRDVHRRMGERLAYTTLMTTLDRLYKKGLLVRRKEGRAFYYSSRFTPGELDRSIVRRMIARLLGFGGEGPEPMLACIVEAISDHDRALLDALDRLIEEKRRDRRLED